MKNNQVVSLLDIYPTLAEMCGLPVSDRLKGETLIPLFADHEASRSRPVVSSWYYGNMVVRSNRWRYIRYRDGTCELYDHEKDPGEHRNLIALPEFGQIVASIAVGCRPGPRCLPVRKSGRVTSSTVELKNGKTKDRFPLGSNRLGQTRSFQHLCV